MTKEYKELTDVFAEENKQRKHYAELQSRYNSLIKDYNRLVNTYRSQKAAFGITAFFVGLTIGTFLL